MSSNKPPETFLLFEIAAGFLLLHVKEWDCIAQNLESAQEAYLDPLKFSTVVETKAIQLFENAEIALESCLAIAKGESTELLRTFLTQNLVKKKKLYRLGVIDPALGKDLCSYGFSILHDKNILELLRLCRYHIKRLFKQTGTYDLSRFEIGLGHSLSRAKLRMDPNRQDKPVQNAVALLENIDKVLNNFSMRAREWYSWHFPELGNLVKDNIKFSEVAHLIGIKENFGEDQFPLLVHAFNGEESIAREIMNAKDISMGQEITEVDIANIRTFTDQVVRLAEQRKTLAEYLQLKLETVAPNLQCLIGDILAAKLIAHAGSLTNLSKFPASTVQILGAEKALFRALKTKTNTPKYGLLFQSSFIGKAAVKNKGRISRYLANKCSLAARIDNFAPFPCSIFGEKLKEQVENRMKYLAEGVATKRNIQVMREAMGLYLEKFEESQKEAKQKEEKIEPEEETIKSEEETIKSEEETIKSEEKTKEGTESKEEKTKKKKKKQKEDKTKEGKEKTKKKTKPKVEEKIKEGKEKIKKKTKQKKDKTKEEKEEESKREIMKLKRNKEIENKEEEKVIKKSKEKKRKRMVLEEDQTSIDNLILRNMNLHNNKIRKVNHQSVVIKAQKKDSKF